MFFAWQHRVRASVKIKLRVIQANRLMAVGNCLCNRLDVAIRIEREVAF